MDTIWVNQRPFRVLRLLGKGKGGYSWLVTDGMRKYVVKQIHHEPCDYYQFGDKLASELQDYKTLSRVGIPMPQLLDVDSEQERILKEYIPGETIWQKVELDAMEQTYFDQIITMCAALYPAGLNIDYFPTNFVVREDQLYYIDYECNLYDPQWNFENWGNQYWWKSPEFLDYVNQHKD